MYVTYFDEVKANPKQGMNDYFIGGICLPINKIKDIEERIKAVSVEVFGTSELTSDTEFHASHIYSGKGSYRGMKPVDRIEIIRTLAEIIDDCREFVDLIYASVDTTKYAKEDAARVAFMFFCERVNMNVRLRGSTILIGDYEDRESKEMIKNFLRFRQSRTDWDYGIVLDAIVDSVHFAKSHHSRLIQLADIYCFCATHRVSGRGGWMAEKFSTAIKEMNFFPSRYKHWPN
jgi:hypothetical protein